MSSKESTIPIVKSPIAVCISFAAIFNFDEPPNHAAIASSPVVK